MREIKRAYSSPNWQEAGVNHLPSVEGIQEETPMKNRRGRKSLRRSNHPLRDLRLARGLTLDELSQKSDLSPSYLSRLESGSRRLNIDTINRLAQALPCDPRDLLALNKEMENKWNFVAPNTRYPISGTVPLFLYSDTSTYGSTSNSSNQPQIPLYGSKNEEGKINFYQFQGLIPCPHDLLGVPGAFALVVPNDSMAPRYRKGERVLVHPGKPLTPKATAVVITPAQEVILGEFVAWRHLSEVDVNLLAQNDEPGQDLGQHYALEIRQYNPSAEFQGNGVEKEQIILLPNQILSIARVVGTVGQ